MLCLRSLGFLYGIEIFEYIHKHRLFVLDIGFVCVSNEIHIKSLAWLLFAILLVSTCKERFFFFELVKVFSTAFRSYTRHVRSLLLSQCRPIHSLEKWMILNFINSTFAKSHLWLTDNLLKNIGGSWR